MTGDTGGWCDRSDTRRASPRNARLTSDGAKKRSHDHREFCGAAFVPPDNPYRTGEDRHEATAARGEFPDDYYWTCEDCLGDFERKFRWRVLTGSPRILSRADPAQPLYGFRS